MFKKISASFVLLSFLAIAVFSFAGMAYGADGSMQSNCPFSAVGTSLCPQNSLPGAVNHISAHQSFINAPINPGITTLIISLLIFAYAALALSFIPLLYKPPALATYNRAPFTSHDRKMRHWLSLFEHSPSH